MNRGRWEYASSNAAAASISLLLCLLAVLSPLKAQAAVEQHLFDPTISLTGGCSTDKYDEISDPWCPGPPGPGSDFDNPNIAIDSFGDMYVSSEGGEETPGRVDVFSPSGQFITELNVPGAGTLAVDPKGNLYVNQQQNIVNGLHQVTLFRPTAPYDPAVGEISYEDPGEVIIENQASGAPCSEHTAIFNVGLAVDPVTEHLFVSPGGRCVGEWSSAEEGPELLDPTIGSGALWANTFIAVDHTHSRLYVSEDTEEGDSIIEVFELEAPHARLGTIDGHSTPNGKFLAPFGYDTLAVDETSGNLIVSELNATPLVYEFGMGLDAGEELLNTYKYAGFKPTSFPLQIAVDNALSSPNHRTFYITTSPEGQLHHTFAFRFSEVGPPEVESPTASGISETEAVLGATINPQGGETTYRVEYTTAASGFAGANVAAEGTLPSGIAAVPVSGLATGLTPGAQYRFRVVAENEIGTDEAEGAFRTYPTPFLGGPCPNETLRIGPATALPDCRAYELVTPADTGGRTPKGAADGGRYFPTLHASPDGNRASFRIEGGALPGFEAAGSGDGDDYLARRGSGGWSTELVSPSGTEAPKPTPGGFSPDQEYSFWGENTVVQIGEEGFFRNPFIHYPDGHSEPVGRGSLGIDREVDAKLIGPNGSHTIFQTLNPEAVRLEPNAPAAGTGAIYDRTADEVTHVVSLLPGDATPGPGENAKVAGFSFDGAGVAFRLAGDSMLYLRQNNEETYEVGAGVTFAGVAEGGGRVFYLKGGDLFAYDTATEAAKRFSSGGDTTPVNVSPDGTTAYFVSPDVLTTKANPNGAHASVGKDNLYVSREGQVGFVGTVEPEDVEEALGGGFFAGLGLWIGSLEKALPAVETSRTTPDGGALVFESRAQLTAYDPAGHTEVYRYDGATLSCVSCNPTGAAASADASLQSLPGRVAGGFGPLTDRLANLSADGARAFFQSYEPLVAADIDGRLDVYEWEAQGTGSCTVPGGCVYLISSPGSERDEDLFAVSESGGDVFFRSSDLLAGGDTDATTSIYDARVGGGFPEVVAAEPCQGEGCHPASTPPPLLPTAASSFPTSGNLTHRRCAKGKRQVRRHGKTRCVKKHRHHPRHHHKAASKGKGSK